MSDLTGFPPIGNELVERLRTFIKPNVETQPFPYMQAMADAIDALSVPPTPVTGFVLADSLSLKWPETPESYAVWGSLTNEQRNFIGKQNDAFSAKLANIIVASTTVDAPVSRVVLGETLMRGLYAAVGWVLPSQDAIDMMVETTYGTLADIAIENLGFPVGAGEPNFGRTPSAVRKFVMPVTERDATSAVVSNLLLASATDEATEVLR